VAEKKPPPNPYKPEDIAKLREYLNKWKAKLGLAGWRIFIRQGKHASMAMLSDVSLHDRYALIKLGHSFSNDPILNPTNDAGLEQLIVHELLHLLCEPIKAFAIDHEMKDHADVIAAEHDLIHPLEALLIPSSEER
jgi:hypothetical protein